MKLPKHNDLYFAGNWSGADHTGWSILNYVVHAATRSPGISKRNTYYCLTKDLKHIGSLYPETECIQRKVQSMLKDFKKKDDSAALAAFWGNIKQEMEIGILEKQKNLVLMDASSTKWMAIGLDIAADTTLNSKKRGLEEGPSSSSSSLSKRQQTTTSGSESPCLEVDNIYVESSSLSIGTIIKNRALTIHKDYKEGKKLANRERKIMVAGLSSILDLSDNSMESQRSLFDDKEWDSVNKYFMEQLPLQSDNLPELIDDTLTIICKVVEKQQSVQDGLNYLYRLYGDLSLTKMDRNLLKIIEHMLDLLIDYRYLLTKCKPSSMVTEHDNYSILWSRIFQLLFAAGEDIRVKCGESISYASSKYKQELYSESKHVVGFKVDARFVVDMNDKEYDVAAMELAKDGGDSKIITDLGKLIREGKENLDMLLDIMDNDWNCHSFIIQLSGPDCQLSTVHLVSSGLYVVLPRYQFSLPPSFLQLANFRDAMIALLTMKNHLNHTARMIIQKKQRRNSVTEKLGRFGKSRMNEKMAWRRGTWYTPSQNDQSVLPDDFYGINNTVPDIRILFSDNDDNDDDNSEAGSAVSDIYGYQKHEHGWLNVFTNKVVSKHPFK
ncbi:unnamed protein product [Absidia cylindrospora]